MRTFSVKRRIAPRNAVVQVLTWYVFALVLVNQERRISVFFSAGFFNVTPFILVEITLNSKSKSVVEMLKYNFFYSSRFGKWRISFFFYSQGMKNKPFLLEVPKNYPIFLECTSKIPFSCMFLNPIFFQFEF